MPPRKKPVGAPDEPAPVFNGFEPILAKFLNGLKKNNNKEWFEEHRDDYERGVREPSKALVAAMGTLFRSHKLPFVADPKRSLFRINRDIRFSNDKSPYKTHLGIVFPHVKSSKDEWAGCYLGIEPDGKSGIKASIGGGIYQPMPPQLKRIRERISTDHKKLTAILSTPAVVKTYASGLHGDALKRMPVGYQEEHPAAQLLKQKDFLLDAPITLKQLQSEELPDILLHHIEIAKPFVDFFC